MSKAGAVAATPIKMPPCGQARRKPSLSREVVGMVESKLAGLYVSAVPSDESSKSNNSELRIKATPGSRRGRAPLPAGGFSEPRATDDEDEQIEVPISADYTRREFDDELRCSSSPGHAGQTTADSAEVSSHESSQAADAPDRESKKVTLDDFEMLKFIGKGAYGMVYLVKHKHSDRYFAMKVLRKASILVHSRSIAFTKTERAILEAVQHPFIVKLYFAFQSDHKLFLVMEYISGGELFTHMANERVFTEEQSVFYIAELVLALNHLHKQGIIYRDLKPENILLSADGHLVLTDFGLSKTALDGDGRTNTFCGTPAYMAPEVLDQSRSYDKSVDWWSMGVLLYEMLTGRTPFKGKNHKQIYDSIIKKKVFFPKYLSPDARDILSRLLKKSPSKRLGYGPDGYAKIKQHRLFRNINWQCLETSCTKLTPPIHPTVMAPDDVSNFDRRFTDQDIAASLFCETGEGMGGLPPLDHVERMKHERGKYDDEGDWVHVDAEKFKDNPDRCGGGTGWEPVGDGDDEIDPDTIFSGFSYVAPSSLALTLESLRSSNH